MTAYVLSEDAGLDHDSIWDYIAEDSINAADRWVTTLFEAFADIVKTPGIGHKRDDLAAYPVLFWPTGTYLIIYRETCRSVEIVAVIQSSRDMPSFLHRRFTT